MKRVCPTINELLAFDAAARHLTFTEAASELCVTPSAISRQIAGMEDFLGVQLFLRSGKRLVLTSAGRRYIAKIEPSLKTITLASLDLLASRGDISTITLSSVPTFATKWLIPRLPEFRKAQPGIMFSFREHLSNSDPFPPDIDAAIRYGNGDWPNVTAEYLTGKKFIVICAPDLMSGSHPLRELEDLKHHALLQHEGASSAWSIWFDNTGVRGFNSLAGPRLQQYSVLIQAVIAGLGVGLVPECLVLEELASGLVKQPFTQSAKIEQGHYLCYTRDRMESQVFRKFRDWLLNSASISDGLLRSDF